MSISRRRILAGAALAMLATLAPVAPALAQDKPITIVVGSPAGGTTDALARLIARSMAETLHRSVVVDNRPGAGGNIAAQYVARATPDGSTLLMSFTGHTINATLYKNLPFDPVKDFTPITMVARVPSVLVARKGVPFDTTAGLVDYAKKNPGKLTFAIGAQGSSLHLASEQFKLQTGTDIVNIPYKGTNPALTDLLGGTVDLMFASTVNVLPHVKAGTLKFLGVSSKDALAQFPGVPPIGQTVKGFESSAWFGLFGPARLPQAVTDQLYRAVKIAVDDPAYRKRMETEAASAISMTPQAFGAFVRSDIAHWARVIQASGTKVE
ncbi:MULTISPECIES: tripartite tricarboxylate transporter substrate binding protein [Cupriavidus]|uniref:Tripartite tricarboxylate transporter substrate binding protein n=1 Tax=Cupriavidus pauculus TaxID=82633 RepID=A0A3G8H7M5_9BURK|nr:MULTISPECIES: tripartite tricarboxylate transporter substrate binding protein [Cupriavidus]AZG16474.1 tripartite tricarboxylate transporter substrate binding protein [Cupriavidus pauculus]MDT6963127.1 tripartite tricarboxylate transporter substrate binding protein [Cupriavidus sp. SZY C1]